MAFGLLCDGNTYARGTTLGNILQASTLRITDSGFFWPKNGNGTLYSQAENSTTNREFQIYNNGGVFTYFLGGVGGSEFPLGNYVDIFGDQDLEGPLDITIDLAAKTFTMILNGVTYLDAAPVQVGTARRDGMSFRIGGRSPNSAPGSGGEFLAPAGAVFGTVSVYIDGVEVRRYVPPESGTKIPEVIQGTEAGVGGTPNFIPLDDGSGPFVSVSNHANGYAFGKEGGGVGSVDFSLGISGAPQTIERTTDGGVTWESIGEISTPAHTDTVTLPTGQYEIGYRLAGATVTPRLITTGIGPIIAIDGHSNASSRGDNNQTLQPSVNGVTAFLYGNDHVIKEARDPLDSASGQVYSVSQDGSAGGHWAILWANKWLEDNPDTPIMFVPSAKGGAKLPDYYPSDSTSTLYGAMKRRIQNVGGVSFFLFALGSSDSNDGVTYAQALTRYDTVLNALESDFGVPVYLATVQKYTDSRPESAVIIMRQATQDTAAARPNVVAWGSIYEMDLTQGPNADNVHWKTDQQLQIAADAAYLPLQRPGTTSRLVIAGAAGTFDVTVSNGQNAEILNEPFLFNSGTAYTPTLDVNAGDPITATATERSTGQVYELAGAAGSDIVEVSAIPDPTAIAGQNITATVGQAIQLTGATVTDADAVAWTCTSGQTPTIVNGDTLTPTITFNEPGAHTLRLTATNAVGEAFAELQAAVEDVATVIQSTILLSLPGIPDGAHDVVIVDRVGGINLTVEGVTFADGTASALIPLAIGSAVDYYTYNETTREAGLQVEGITT